MRYDLLCVVWFLGVLGGCSVPVESTAPPISSPATAESDFLLSDWSYDHRDGWVGRCAKGKFRFASADDFKVFKTVDLPPRLSGALSRSIGDGVAVIEQACETGWMVYAYEVATGKDTLLFDPTKCFPKATKLVHRLCTDRSRILVFDRDKCEFRVFETRTQKEVARIQLPDRDDSATRPFAISPKGDHCAIATEEGVEVFTLPAAKRLFSGSVSKKTKAFSIEFDETGKLLLSHALVVNEGVQFQDVRVFDVNTTKTVWQSHSDSLVSARIHGKTVSLAYSGLSSYWKPDVSAGRIDILHLETGKLLATAQLTPSPLKAVHIDFPRDRLYAVSGGWKVWKLSEILQR